MIFGAALLCLIASLLSLLLRRRRSRSFAQLAALSAVGRDFTPINSPRRTPLTLDAICIGVFIGLPLTPLLLSADSFKGRALLGLGGVYLFCVLLLLFRRWQRTKRERLTLFSLPLTLESLILLVEAGVGLLAAIRLTAESLNNPVTELLKKLHQLTDSGVPMSEALKTVAKEATHPIEKHVLLHLHVASTEGGALASSLRNLSDYAHLEWKLSVERRVRKLENTVVFPVFVGVMGLLLLSASAPLIPILSLRDNLHSTQMGAGSAHHHQPWLPPNTFKREER